MNLITIVGDKAHVFNHVPKVVLESDKIRQFKIYLYSVFECIYYKSRDWDVIVKLKDKHSIYINHLTFPKLIVTKKMNFFHLTYVANIVGCQNLIDITLLADLVNVNSSSIKSIRAFLYERLKYEL